MGKSIIGATGQFTTGTSGFTFFLGLGQAQVPPDTDETSVRTKIDRAATLRNFRVYVSANNCPLSVPVSLRKNGVNVVTINVTPGGTGWWGSTNEIQVESGDVISVQVRSIGAGNLTIRSVVCELEEAGDGAHTYLGLYARSGVIVGTLNTASDTRFFPICGRSENNGAANDTDLANQWARTGIPVAGTLSNLRARVQLNTRTTATILRTRINGVDGGCAIVVPALAGGEFEDLVGFDSFLANTTVGYKTQTGSGSGTVNIRKLNTLFESSVEQTPLVAARSIGQEFTPNALEDIFIYPFGSHLEEIGRTEPHVAIKIPFSTIAFRLSAHVESVAGSPLVLRSRVNGSNGNQSITVPVAGSGTFQSLGQDILNTNDLLNAMIERPALSSTYRISWLSAAIGDPLPPPPPTPPAPPPGVPCDNPTFLPEPCDPTPVPLDLLWPFRSNWAEPVEITREFKTDIIVSRSGREQRRAVRQESRRSILFQNVFTGPNRREYDMLLALNQFGRFTVADWSRYIKLAEQLAPSDIDAAYAETQQEDPYWFSSGEPVVLVYGTQVGLRFASGVETTGVLSFEDTDSLTWPIGTKVYPGLLAFHQDDVSTTRLTNDVTTGRFVFFVDPGANVIEPVGEPDTMFEDREIFLFRPNWVQPVAAGDMWPVDIFDVGHGRVFRYRAITHRQNTLQMTFVRRGREEADAIDRFFMRHLGRAREFYTPTHANDIVLATGGFESSDTVLLVEGEEFAAAYGDDPTRGAISVVLRNGTRINRLVSSIAVDASGMSAITLTQTMGQTISSGEILMISWLNVCRFGSDELTMQWLTDGVANCRLSLVALEQLPAEIEHTDSNTGL